MLLLLVNVEFNPGKSTIIALVTGNEVHRTTARCPLLFYRCNASPVRGERGSPVMNLRGFQGMRQHPVDRRGVAIGRSCATSDNGPRHSGRQLSHNRDQCPLHVNRLLLFLDTVSTLPYGSSVSLLQIPSGTLYTSNDSPATPPESRKTWLTQRAC